MSFSSQEPVVGDFERRANDLETNRCANDFTAVTAASSDVRPTRQLMGWVVEESAQAVVARMAQHS
jgi:hypothetical protein